MQPNDIIETSILRGQVKLLQPRHGFHASSDTVLLATAATPFAQGQVLDVGCGVGSVGLSVALKKSDIKLIGIDIQPEMVALAQRNAVLNGIEERCTFYSGDIGADTALPANGFDLVVTNPPFQAEGRHIPASLESKAFAHGEDASGVTLKKWCKYLHNKLKQGGRMVMIHRADRLDEIIQILTERRWFGGLTILPIHPRQGEPAKRVLVTARKERYAPLVLKSGLVMHEMDGSPTPAASSILEGRDIIHL